MNESLLKKEFKNKDVNRVRNLIKKDFSSKTSSGVGYKKATVQRNEGDIWEEDGRKWTISNGVKQTVSKLKDLKKLNQLPLTCPKCNGSMKHWLSKKMFKIHGFCFDCTINYEAELRKAGLYEEYEKAMITNGMKAFAKDLENWVLDSLNESSNFVTEDGEVEEWKSNSKNKELVLEKLKEFSTYINNSLD